MPMDVHLDDGSITGPDGLLERLQTLTDPRARRGKRHRLAGLLAIAAAAVLGGARSYTAIAEFASELDAATLARLGTWRRPYSDCWIPPSEATLRRTLQQVDADALDRLVGDWLADQQPPAQAGDQPAAVRWTARRCAARSERTASRCNRWSRWTSKARWSPPTPCTRRPSMPAGWSTTSTPTTC